MPVKLDESVRLTAKQLMIFSTIVTNGLIWEIRTNESQKRVVCKI